ncbi:DEAD/DEAH box helicase family protein [Bartonella sp. AA56HLJMS]|uniref:DEAD/DEAH box helicase family protein n=1 Tax=Bartonella sp. AA56HLJMS TaxID=3243434 RepID=UPI0035CF9591
MAFGTEKIFTSFKIAQQIAGTGERVLFLVPFLALMSQTIREWTRLYRSTVSFLCGVF